MLTEVVTISHSGVPRIAKYTYEASDFDEIFGLGHILSIMPQFWIGFQSHLLHTHEDGAKPLDFGVSDIEHHNSSYGPRSYFDN